MAIAEINNRLFFRLFQVTNTMHTKGTKALSQLGVTTQQWSVLGALSRPQAKNGISVNELSEYLIMTRQNLSGLLDRLEREEIVERVPSVKDRRAKLVRLTHKGEALWLAIDPAIYQFYDAALQNFSFDDRVEFLHKLNKLQKNMSTI